jgi:predicted DNA-binding transcriptional regulator AlpA
MGEPQLTDFLSESEVPKLMGICTMTMWRWQTTGRFPQPSIRIGKRKLYRKAMLTAWLEQQAAETEAANVHRADEQAALNI